LDFNSYKILKIINKYPNEVDIDVLVSKSNVPKDDFLEILFNLRDFGYIKFVRDGYVESTNKGKTYKSVSRNKWISEHIVETIALIFSIASFGLSVFSIIYSILTRQSLMQ